MRFILLVTLLLCPSWVYALSAPTHDHTTTSGETTVKFNATNTGTVSHTRGATCPNALAVIAVGAQDSNSATTLDTLTYDGNSVLSNVIAELELGNAQNDFRMYYHLAPGSGAKNVTATFSETVNDFVIRVSTYCGVNQSTPIGTPATFNSFGDMSVNVSSASDELVVDGGYVAAGPTMSIGGGHTQRFNEVVTSNQTDVGGEAPGSTTVTMSWTGAGSNWSALAGVSLKPAPATRRPIAPILLGE